jgi:hypothetical protein
VPSMRRSPYYHENYTKVKDAQIQIEEAVIGLSRNIFQNGGKIIFGGHPSISPLVAMVATEFKLLKENNNYSPNYNREKHINIFQSKAYESVIPKETSILFDLGYSDIIWTDAINDERFNPIITDKPQCEKSLEFMRIEMMGKDIDALVCIGGMEGVELEFKLFRKLHPTKPVYLLKTTGGASKILADKFKFCKYVKIADNSDMVKIKNKLFYIDNKNNFEIIPYSFITASIVDEVIKNRHLL